MADNDAELRIGAEASGVEKGMQDAARAVQSGISQMQTHFDGLSATFAKLNGLMIGFAAVLGGGKAFKDAVEETVNLTKESMKLGKTLGITATEASVLNIALGDIYQSGDTVVAATAKITKTLRTNEDAFHALGVATKTTDGHFRNSLDIMLETNQALLKFREGTDRNIEGQKIYGKAWAEVAPLLKLNTELMEESRKKAEALGLVVGEENVQATAKYRAAMNDMHDVMSALMKVVGDAVLPILTDLGNWFAENGPRAVQVMKTAIAGLVSAFYGIKMVVEIVWETIKYFVQSATINLLRFADAAGHALKGDFAGAKRAWDEGGQMLADSFDATMQRIVKDAETNRDKIFATLYGALEGKPTATKGSNGGAASSGGDDKTTKDKSRMSAWEAELAQTKVFFQQKYDLQEYSKQQEKEYWESILRNVKLSGEEKIAVTRKIADLELDILKKSVQQRRALNEASIDETERVVNDAIAMEEERARREFELGNISKTQLLAQQKDFEQRRFEIQTAAQQARIDAMQGDPNHDPVALQKLLDQMAEIERKHALGVEKINTDLAVSSKEEWAKMFTPVTSAIEKSISGMIMGTQTLKKAMSNIFQSILGEFLSMLSKKAAAWAATEMAQKSATLAAMLGISSAKVVEAGTVVSANAAEAASGAAASQAAIPIAGPGLAAAAFAATLAMVLGAKSLFSARGGFDIPAGVNPLAQLHEKEMVLPAHDADVIRGMASGGSGGDVHIYSRSDNDVIRVGNLKDALRSLNRNFVDVRR